MRLPQRWTALRVVHGPISRTWLEHGQNMAFPEQTLASLKSNAGFFFCTGCLKKGIWMFALLEYEFCCSVNCKVYRGLFLW
jgi:hypothetical protein